MGRVRWMVSCLAAVVALGGVSASPATGSTVETKRYIVVFDATQAADGTFALGGSYVLNHD